jgi:hypothetical protein
VISIFERFWQLTGIAAGFGVPDDVRGVLRGVSRLGFG